MSATPELALLAHMLRDGDFRPVIKGDVTEEHFLTDAGKLLYQFVSGYHMMSDGAARWPSLEVVKERFGPSGIELPKLGLDSNIGRLVFEVQDRKVRQELHGLSELLSLASTDFTADAMAAVQGAVDQLKTIQGARRGANQLDLSYAIPDIVMNYALGEVVPNGMPWPWPTMTLGTKGLHRKEFTVLAGRPKARKTFVALCVAVHAIMQWGARVLFVSPEMPAKQIMLRVVATMAKARYTEFKNAALEQAELERFMMVCDAFARLDGDRDDTHHLRIHQAFPHLPYGAIPAFVVVEGANKSVSWIESQIDIHRPDIVIVDSFYRLSAGHGKKSDTDWKVVSHVSRALKDLAMTSDVSMVGTHQLNRDAEHKVGSISNLALADAVGQDADLIMRVITGRINGIDRSALYVLGGREAPFDGVIINNRPCFDFEEVAPIDNLGQVEELLKKEAEDDTDDGNNHGKHSKKGKQAAAKAPRVMNTPSDLAGMKLKKGAAQEDTTGTDLDELTDAANDG